MAHQRLHAGVSPVAGLGDALPDTESAGLSWRDRKRSRVLSPVARLVDIVVGLLVVLAVVGALAGTSEGEARRITAAAAGSSCAWAAAAAVLYLVATIVEHRRGRALLTILRNETDPERARHLIAESLPPLVAASVRSAELEHVRRQLVGMQELYGAGVVRRDVAAAGGVFLLVFAATIPVIAPFLLPITPRTALVLSSVVALGSLFVTGHRLGTRVSGRPLPVATAMLVTGAALLAIARIFRG